MAEKKKTTDLPSITGTLLHDRQIWESKLTLRSPQPGTRDWFKKGWVFFFERDVIFFWQLMLSGWTVVFRDSLVEKLKSLKHYENTLLAHYQQNNLRPDLTWEWIPSLEFSMYMLRKSREFFRLKLDLTKKRHDLWADLGESTKYPWCFDWTTDGLNRNMLS